MPNILPNADELFRLIVEEAKDFAIFLLDTEGQIISWNRGAERIFGWCEAEIVGRHFSMLFTEEDRKQGVPEKELEEAARSGRGLDTRWHMKKEGRLFADGVTTPLRSATGEIIGYSKIARDVTDRYMTERRLATQLALTNLLNTREPVETTARHFLRTICENLGWDVGALWRTTPAGDELRPVDVWAASDASRAVIDAVTSVAVLARGQGLPGRVLEAGSPAWLNAIDDDDNLPRAAAMLRLGMRSAFAFPITSHGNTTGVMEFFSHEVREPDQALMPIMTLIGAQIGDYFDRVQTTEALRVSEERYRVISETAHDAIFTIDRDSRVLFVNKAVENLFGYKPEEIIGKSLDIIIPHRLRESHRRGIERYLRTRERHIDWSAIELPALHRDGHEFPVELSFGEFHDESGTIFTGFARDITERMKAREELQKSLAEAQHAKQQLERRTEEEVSFRHLASALSGAVEMEDVLHEITSRATMVTRADGVYVERIRGADKEVEVVSAFGRGTPKRGTRVPYPGSLTDEIMKQRIPVVLADMAGFGRAMAPYLAERCGDCEVLVTPLIADETPLGALVLLNSRSSGRHFGDEEVSRAKTLGDLASLALRRVRLMEDEREAKVKAEAAVRVRDETLGIVSHDLRNPLTTIALSVELLADAPEEEQREHADTIRTAAKTMQRLIQDLLDVARVESGRLTIQKAIIDASELAHSACDAHTPIAETKRIKLICDIGELPKINADRDRLLQVFGNLIGNAIKFTPPGGTITVRGFTERGMVVFQIQDSGSGIPESDLRNVFRPYWQAKKTAHMGAGLGLAIVRGIMDAHGGTASATNGPGGGALFTISLPGVTS